MSCDIRRSALLTWIRIVICMIVFCGSAAYLLLYGQDKISAEKEFNQMRKSARLRAIEGVRELNILSYTGSTML